ncbi:hypothetical protein BDR06DRAFT_1008848 [Suillus hirtellus]|nr:hypothetical protein BDR06DRAFT_1008848 [Suillus hirtellus]
MTLPFFLLYSTPTAPLILLSIIQAMPSNLQRRFWAPVPPQDVPVPKQPLVSISHQDDDDDDAPELEDVTNDKEEEAAEEAY